MYFHKVEMRQLTTSQKKKKGERERRCKAENSALLICNFMGIRAKVQNVMLVTLCLASWGPGIWRIRNYLRNC